jgi:uncharacterized membrane protein YozB (DUF420 family)
MDLRLQPGFLGTGASMLADITVLAYIFLIVPAMLVGYFFARRKWFEPHHKLTMTSITLVNWVLIVWLMLTSYRDGVLPNLASNLSNPTYILPTIHLITGALAQFTATYLVIRMWFEKQLPDGLKVKNIKRYMRFTLACWLITALLGVGIYLVWYVFTPNAAANAEVIATPEVTAEAVTTAEAVAATEEAAPAATPTARLAPTAAPANAPATTQEASAALPPDPTDDPSMVFALAPGEGSVMREYWLNVAGFGPQDLLADADYPNAPTGCDYLRAIDAPYAFGTDFGQRIRGFIVPPTTGEYTFWIASDNGGDFLLSTDTNAANAVRVAYVDMADYSNRYSYDEHDSQESAPIRLEAGQQYYFEVLHKQDGSGQDQVSVAWAGPGIERQVISGAYLITGGLACGAAGVAVTEEAG